MGRGTDERGGNARLVALKVRGRLPAARHAARVARRRASRMPSTDAIPAPGNAWVDAALLSGLELPVGDALLLGDASCALTG